MRGRMQGDAHTGNKISFGSIGLQAIGRGYLTTRQIEAARRVITRTLKRGGKTWIRVFPDKPVTKRPAETRMGKGKGAVDTWVASIHPGRVLYEIDGVPEVMLMKHYVWLHTNCPLKQKSLKELLYYEGF